MSTSPPMPPATAAPASDAAARTAAEPRPGQLTPGWRLATGAVWLMVFVAMTGVWNASRQLGLATWWLGPVSEPRPFIVMLVPFVAPVVMVAATLNNARRLPWYGLTASAVGVAIGIGDLDHVRRLAYVEIAISVAAALVSVASLSGVYRSAPVAADVPVEPAAAADDAAG